VCTFLGSQDLKEDLPLFISTFKVAITDVNPRIPWVLLADPMGSVENTLEINMLMQVKIQQNHICRINYTF